MHHRRRRTGAHRLTQNAQPPVMDQRIESINSGDKPNAHVTPALTRSRSQTLRSGDQASAAAMFVREGN